MLLAFDLATRLCGWTAGDGRSIPVAGAFKMAQHGEDIGAMLGELDDNLNALFDRFQPTHVCFEAPILPQGRRGDGGSVVGSLLVRRKLFNLGGHLEFVCHRRGIACGEEEVRAIKRELAGTTKAQKADMVAAAEKIGVRLPATQAAGREDAADSVGVWLLGLRRIEPALSAEFDRRLYSSRGLLV